MFKTSLSTFFILFSSEGRKCDFFVRQNDHSTSSSSMLFKPAVGNSPPFWTHTNLPFHEFPEILNHERWLKYLGNSWKGRFVQNGGELPTAAPSAYFENGADVGASFREIESVITGFCWQSIHRTVCTSTIHARPIVPFFRIFVWWA